MATQTHKFLGRAQPGAATPVTLYTAPTATTTLCSTITICNTSGSDDSARIFWVPFGGSAQPANAIIYDTLIPAGDPFAASVIHVLEAGDFIVVYSANGNLTFSASGLEIA